jgi:hypothetical protein
MHSSELVVGSGLRWVDLRAADDGREDGTVGRMASR